MSRSLTRLNLSKARLLLVDDSETSMELLAQALLGFGVRHSSKCESAADGARAIQKERFDLLLVDHDMPGEDGLDFCRAVRGDPRSLNYTTPLILLSPLPSREVVAQARDAGVHFVIAKPVSPTTLLQRIEWVARSQRDFVTSDGYRGPDRRFQKLPLQAGAEERREENLRLMADPDRLLSQDSVDALFD